MRLFSIVDMMDDSKALPKRIWSAPRASPALVARARELRREATPAEKLHWQVLRGKQVGGHKFRRQHPIAGYIADFYCPISKVVIELDGNVHDTPEQQQLDATRSRMIELNGVRVLRFRNEDVLERLEQVLKRIEEVCSNGEPPI